MTVTARTRVGRPVRRREAQRTQGSRKVLARVIMVFLAALVLVAIFAPLIAPYRPDAQNLSLAFRPPIGMRGTAPGHLLGTDQLGQDILSQMIYGTRLSLIVGVIATLIAGIIGLLIGLIAGYFGGIRDQVLMRLADMQLAFPSILLAMVLVAVIGPSLLFLVLVLGLTGWVPYARVVRAEVLVLRQKEFVTAARGIGVSDAAIIRRHMIPNVMAPLATIATLQVASMIIIAASLSYLGLGVPPSDPSWGAMIQEGQLYLRTAWWVGVFPGLALVLTTLAINLAGDLLRDIADPKAYLR
jgi:peptide/nickel transport system permease protein